ncbi:hypothetical protein ACHAW6_007509 [Cyclotella cf. meneghiniana]
MLQQLINNPYLIDQIIIMQKQERKAYRCSDYMTSPNTVVSASDRQALCNWGYITIAACHCVDRSAAVVAFSYFDRFMSTSHPSAQRALVCIHDYQLAFVACLVIALKVHSGFNVEADFVSSVVCSNMYEAEEIIEMEKQVLEALQWRLTGPTPHDFIDRFLEVVQPIETVHLEFLTHFSKALAEFSLTKYSIALHAPSIIAYSSILCALEYLDSMSSIDSFSFRRYLEMISGLNANDPKVRDLCKTMISLMEPSFSYQIESAVQLQEDDGILSVSSEDSPTDDTNYAKQEEANRKPTETMSDVEEALERIKNHQGVEGFVICDHDGVVLRCQPSMTKKAAENLAQCMTKLAQTAKNVVRDLNPTDDLRIMRIKTSRKEVIVSPDENFIIVVLQQWTPAPTLT